VSLGASDYGDFTQIMALYKLYYLLTYFYQQLKVSTDEFVQMIDIRPLFDAEVSKGKPSGPMFVNGWPSDRDPRFCEPVNPLYDPLASRDTDWRCKLDIVSYLRFSDYVAHVKGMLYRYVIESAEDEDIFNVSFILCFSVLVMFCDDCLEDNVEDYQNCCVLRVRGEA